MNEEISLRLHKSLTWLMVLLIYIAGGNAYAESEDGSRQQHANTACLNCHDEMHEEMGGFAHHTIRNACVLCHGQGQEHIKSKGRKIGEGLRVYRDSLQTVQQDNKVCLQCHGDANRLHWTGSAHEAEELLCNDCHTVHSDDLVLKQETESIVCYSCHQSVRSDMLKPYRHPLPEGKMGCSNCHQSHGSASADLLKAFNVITTCTECHAEKRGPFLWEHYPVSEDCMLCHDAHGSVHSGMLTKRRPQLCQSCHQPTAEFAARHARRPLGYWEPGASDNVNRLVLGESCMSCHVQVHGSNHPSGSRLMR